MSKPPASDVCRKIKKRRGKSKIDEVTREQSKILLRAAIFDAMRWHLHIDAMLLNQTCGKKLDSKLVSEIINNYGIARNFKKVGLSDTQKKGDENGNVKKSNKDIRCVEERKRRCRNYKISVCVNEITLKDCLTLSAKECFQLARKIRCKELSSIKSPSKKCPNRNYSLPLSAASKLLWFRFPSRWTMYDRNVTSALIATIPPGKDSESERKFCAVYEQLRVRDFTGECCKIEKQPSFAGTGLYASKILDKYLFLIGLDDTSRENFVDFLEKWAEGTLGEERNERIENLTSDLLHLYRNKGPMATKDWDI